jgi:hypothetical protein
MDRVRESELFRLFMGGDEWAQSAPQTARRMIEATNRMGDAAAAWVYIPNEITRERVRYAWHAFRRGMKLGEDVVTIRENMPKEEERR